MPLFQTLEDGPMDDPGLVVLATMEPLKPWQEDHHADSIVCPCGNDPSSDGFDLGVYTEKGVWTLIGDHHEAWYGLVQCQRCGLVYDTSDENNYFLAPEPEKGCRYCDCKYAHSIVDCPGGSHWHSAYINYPDIYRGAHKLGLHWTLPYCVAQQLAEKQKV